MYYFIINPTSRSGEGRRVWKQLELLLKERGIEYQALYTKYPGHGTKLAKRCSRISNAQIIAVGGDGTMDEVINGLPLNQTATVGFIPIGSGNDFARGMHLPKESQQALERILNTPNGTPMDIGTVQTPKRLSHFGISSGFGYDADVCYEVSHSSVKKVLNRLHLGKLVYAYAAVKLIFTFRPADVDLIVNDVEQYHFKKTYLISAMNLPYQGGGFCFSPNASHTDGELDFLIVSGMPKLVILLLFPTAYFGKHLLIPGVRMIRARKLSIRSSIPQKIHQDGEFAGISKQLTYQAQQEAIRFL